MFPPNKKDEEVFIEVVNNETYSTTSNGFCFDTNKLSNMFEKEIQESDNESVDDSIADPNYMSTSSPSDSSADEDTVEMAKILEENISYHLQPQVSCTDQT